MNIKLINSRGSALMTSMIAAAILGAVAITMMQSKKTAIFIQNHETADRDIERAASDLGSLLANPAHCNATVKNLTLPNIDTVAGSKSYRTSLSSLSSTTGSITSFTFKRCSNPPGCSSTIPVMKYPADTSLDSAGVSKKWNLFIDSDKDFESKEYAKAMISKVEYKLTRPQTRKGEPWPADTSIWGPVPKMQPAVLSLTVQFTKYLGRNANGSEITGKSRDYYYDLYVVTANYNLTTNTLSPAIPTSIIGCALSPSSTIAY